MTAFVSETLTPEQASALEVARGLAAAGIPVFVAPPDPEHPTGFRLPTGWQTRTPDPAVVEAWRPGMALCAVMGCGLDLLDVDAYKGADVSALNGSTPNSYGVAESASGGLHSFIASMGVGSRDAVAPGIDVKGGLADGSSRGFAFLPPTVKPSRVDGTPRPYRWISPPDLPRLATARSNGGDTSGQGLAARIRELRGAGSVTGRATSSATGRYKLFLEQREPQSVAAATAAVTEKLTEVSEWTPAAPAGFRQTLMRAAMTLGGYVGGGWLDEGRAWSQLEAAVSRAWGSPDEDDRRWIEQGLTDGATSPFHVYTPEDEARFGEAAQAVAATRVGPSWSPQRALGSDPFDPAGAVHDQEYAEAVLARNAPVLRYGVDSGTWLKRRRFEAWAELPDQAGAAVADVARLMPLGQSPVPKDTAERTEAHWQAVRRALYLSSAGSGRIERKMRSLVAGGDHPCTVDVSALDASPEVLWAGGYPFDLRACGEVPTLAAIHPDTPHLHTAAVAPAAVATPAWDAFVAAVFPDPELRAWALRVLSIALAGYPDAALPVLYGPERTGKTALVTLVMRVLGSYGLAADPRLLGGSDTHASVVYALKGARLAFIDEGPRRGHLAAERLKQLTGGGQLTGNAMRSNPITFDPTHTLVMTTNDEPPITDPALRARVRLIPCDADAAEVRATRQAITPAVWEAEAPGVLAALMRETAAWLADQDSAGIAAAPASVRALVGEMAAGQDPVREWVEMCTVPTEPGTPGRDLYRRFLLWYEGQPTYRRQSPPTETSFGRSLTEQGFGWVWENPKKERKVRPLSVMNPGGEPPPWAPSGPGSFPAPTDGSRTVADSWPPQLSVGDNSRSGPVFSSSTDSTDSFSRPISHNNTHTSIWSNSTAEIQGEPESDGQLSVGGETNQGLPAETTPGQLSAQLSAGTETVGESAPGVSESAARGRVKIDTSDLSPSVVNAAETVDRSRARALDEGGDDEAVKRAVAAATNRELAQLAEQTGRPKTELRRELTAARKELARREAVAVAGGAVHPLPAVVDRAGRVIAVTAEQAAAIVRARVAASGALTVDVETSGFPVGHADYVLRTVQLGDAEAAVVLDPVAHAEVIWTLLAEAPALHAHSATADLVPLAVAGLLGPDAAVGYDEAWSRMWDTTIPAKLADPASTGSDPGLKRLAATVLGDTATAPGADAGRAALFAAGKWLKDTKAGTPPERSGWAQVDSGCETMLRYAASDVLDTAALARAMPTPDARVAGRERLAQRMVNRGAFRGVRLDPEQIAVLTLAHQDGLADAAGRARSFGVENPGSDQQVAARAAALGANLPQTPGGKPSVAAGVLDPIKNAPGPLGEFVTAVLAHRHHETALGLFLDPYRDLVERGDGRARPTVYTLGTNTGRMSCVRPNLQQLSREGGIRACITADPGHVIVSADFSGVELRVAAALSGDPNLRQIIAAEDAFAAEVLARATAAGDPSEDGQKAARKAILAERGWPHAGVADGLHWIIARQIWGDGATKTNRYVAKRIVFGRVYGGGVKNLSAQVGVPVEVGQQVLDTLDGITPTLKEWSRSISNAAGRGQTRYPAYSGRTIHLPGQTPHAAPNYAIQGSARELLVDALERWADTRWRDATLIPVHDELLAFVPAEDGEAATAELRRVMAGELGGVPIVSEADAPSFAWADST